MTLRLDAQLVDALRAFCRDHAGKPLYLTLASFAEAALSDHLEALRKRVERGGEDPLDNRVGPRHGSA